MTSTEMGPGTGHDYRGRISAEDAAANIRSNIQMIVSAMADKRTAEFVCDASKCPLSGPEVGCRRWLDECAQGVFRKIVSEFSVYGDWNVHEWSVGSGKFYAKLFGPMGFVTIEDYTWKRQGYTVSVRLRQPRGEAEWRNREDLSADESLADAVAWACSLAGIHANEK